MASSSFSYQVTGVTQLDPVGVEGIFGATARNPLAADEGNGLIIVIGTVSNASTTLSDWGIAPLSGVSSNEGFLIQYSGKNTGNAGHNYRFEVQMSPAPIGEMIMHIGVDGNELGTAPNRKTKIIVSDSH